MHSIASRTWGVIFSDNSSKPTHFKSSHLFGSIFLISPPHVRVRKKKSTRLSVLSCLGRYDTCTNSRQVGDAYLNEALELGEYLERKNALTAEKRTLEEKLSDFERKGNHWLELMRNWIIEANQAENLSKQENPSRMRDFLVSIGSNRRLLHIPWSFGCKKRVYW